MASLNKAQILGNLGKDPVIKTTPTGIKLANFSVATSQTWTDKTSGEKKEKTVWHNVVCWRGLADVVEKYVKKGSKVFIEGEIDNRSYDKPDGSKGYTSEIIADNLIMLDGKRDGGGESGSAPSGGSGPAPEDDLPF